MILVEKGAPCNYYTQSNTIEKRVYWIRKALQQFEEPRILDIGCGIGVYESIISNEVLEIIGIDMDLKFIEKCPSDLYNVNFLCTNAEKLPFIEDSFDVVLAIEVLEHVDDLDTILSEIHRVLQESGILVITIPNRGFPFLTHGYRIGNTRYNNFIGIPLPFATYFPTWLLRRLWLARCYDSRTLVKILCKNGFEVEELGFLMPAFDDVGIWGRMPKGLKNIVKRSCSFLDNKESSWFGLSIALLARKSKI